MASAAENKLYPPQRDETERVSFQYLEYLDYEHTPFAICSVPKMTLT